MKYLLPWKPWGIHSWRPAFGNTRILSGCCQVHGYAKLDEDKLHIIGTYWSGDNGKTSFDSLIDAQKAKDEEMRAAGYYLIDEGEEERFQKRLILLL